MADHTGAVHTIRLVRITGGVRPAVTFPPMVVRRQKLTLFQTPGDVPMMELRGTGTISGTTFNDDTPDYAVRRRVRLYAEFWGKIVAETFSNPETGAFSFSGWSKTQKFSVIGYDQTGTWGAVIANGVFPT